MSDIQNDNRKIYEEELKKASDFYLYTLIVSGAVVLSGIIYAVVAEVFMGLLIAIAGILIYMALTSNILYRILGLSYKTDSGRLTVTAVYGREREEIYLPHRLLLCDVTNIGDRAFDHKSSASVRAVHLPSTIKRLGENVFCGCPELSVIYFDGSREEWEAIESLSDTSAYEIVFSTDTEEVAE